jgi:hypothetical protein
MSPMIHVWAAFAAGIMTTVMKNKLGISDAHIHHILGLCAGVMGLALRMTWVKKDLSALQALISKPAAAAGALLFGLLSMTGCSTVTPGEIQFATTVFVGSGLTMATIAEKDPAVKERIKADCKTILLANNALIPTYFPGATSAALMQHSVDTTITILKSKLAGSPNGTLIVDLIQAAEVPFAAVLGSKASPTAAMTPDTRADALAFHTAVSVALAQYVGDLSLMPPLPPAPSTTGAPPPPAPVPSPAPVPPK